MKTKKHIQNKLKKRLVNERQELQRSIMCLEYGDDFLFSDRNGNLSSWKQMVERVRKLDELIKDTPDD